MPDRWNDPRDDRYRREARYRREPYETRFRPAGNEMEDYVTSPRESRSFGGHDHDADWDGEYNRASLNRGYDLDPYYPGGIADSRQYDRDGDRDRTRYAGPASPRGYNRQPPFGGVRASGGGPVYGGDDHETRRQRPGQYADFGFGHPLSRDRGDEAYDNRRDEGRNFIDRAADRVASWFGGHEPEARTGGARLSHRGKGPRGYRRSDQRISDDVNDALTDDHYLDASEVTVTVASCEVTLSGVVADREAKHRAERIAERVSGVDHVQNNLRIGHVEGSRPFSGGNPLTTPGRGFGDSVLEAQARGETPKTVDDDDRKN